MQIKKVYQGTIPENKILDAYSTSQTDTYSCNYVNNIKDNYSTSEIETNKTWINNKPIYRKVFTQSLQSGSAVTTVYGTINNIDNVTFMHAELIADDGTVYTGYASALVSISPNVNNDGRIRTIHTYSGSNLTGIVTVEYTKTTD